jgi:hypothetical protein
MQDRDHLEQTFMSEACDPGVWRLAEALSLEAQADRATEIISYVADVEHLVHDQQTATDSRALAARLRTHVNDWRSEARRLRLAADELAEA